MKKPIEAWQMGQNRTLAERDIQRADKRADKAIQADDNRAKKAYCQSWIAIGVAVGSLAVSAFSLLVSMR